MKKIICFAITILLTLPSLAPAGDYEIDGKNKKEREKEKKKKKKWAKDKKKALDKIKKMNDKLMAGPKYDSTGEKNRKKQKGSKSKKPGGNYGDPGEAGWGSENGESPYDPGN